MRLAYWWSPVIYLSGLPAWVTARSSGVQADPLLTKAPSPPIQQFWDRVPLGIPHAPDSVCRSVRPQILRIPLYPFVNVEVTGVHHHTQLAPHLVQQPTYEHTQWVKLWHPTLEMYSLGSLLSVTWPHMSGHRRLSHQRIWPEMIWWENRLPDWTGHWRSSWLMSAIGGYRRRLPIIPLFSRSPQILMF